MPPFYHIRWLEHDYTLFNKTTNREGAREAVEAMIRAMNDARNDVTDREMTIYALMDIGPSAASAIPSLREILRRESDYSSLHDAANEALAHLSTPAPSVPMVELRNGTEVPKRLVEPTMTALRKLQQDQSLNFALFMNWVFSSESAGPEAAAPLVVPELTDEQRRVGADIRNILNAAVIRGLNNVYDIVDSPVTRSAAGLEEPKDTVVDLLATLDQREHPQLRYQPLRPNEPSVSEYESHGPLIFAWKAGERLQHFWIRRKRSTGQFTIAPIVPALNNPALHPHLLVFQNMFGGQEIPLPVGEPVRLGNREIRITQATKDRYLVSLTDLGSRHGTYVLMDVAGNGSQGIARQINRDDWIAAERLLYVLGTSIQNRDQAGYDRQSYMNKLVEIIQGWRTLDSTLQRRLLSHLLVSRGWTAEGNSRQSAEWLRRFFRIFQHVFYMSPEAAISKGQQGVILFGKIREYLPVNWRGFRSVTHVTPIMTNMKGGEVLPIKLDSFRPWIRHGLVPHA